MDAFEDAQSTEVLQRQLQLLQRPSARNVIGRRARLVLKINLNDWKKGNKRSYLLLVANHRQRYFFSQEKHAA
jgi:hypothetical protein